MDRRRLVKLFLDESREHLGEAHEALESIADEKTIESPLRELMRHAHSLKGMAMSLGFGSLERLAHALEDLFESLHEASPSRVRRVVPLVREGVACMGGIVDAIERDGSDDCARASALALELDRTRTNEEGGGSDSASPPADRTAPEPTGTLPVEPDELRRCRVELLLYREASLSTAQLVSVLRRLSDLGRVEHADPPMQAGQTGRFEGRLALTLSTPVSPDDLEGELHAMPEVACFNVQPLATKRPAESADRQTVRWARVRADLLDVALERALNLIHENRRSRSSSGTDRLRHHLQRTDLLLRELYEHLSELRLTPFQDVMQRLSQTAHEAARELAKPVRFRIEGGSNRIDRSVLDALIDPLQHMIRNAVDHGIEPPAERSTLAKPVEAIIELRVERQGEWVRVSLEDDGRGLDPEALRRSAVARGMLDAERAAALPDHEACLLATLPSLTTAPRATRFSGRGIGLDVARDRVERLGGRIEIGSTPGIGTRIVLVLPVNLALVQALLVRCGEECFAVPISRIQSTLGWENGPGAGETPRAGGLELVHLRDRLGLRPTVGDAGREAALLLDLDGRTAALVVDEVIGRREIVVRPLGPPLNELRLYSGAALLESGTIALLLDPDSIIGSRKTVPDPGPGVSPDTPAPSSAPVPRG